MKQFILLCTVALLFLTGCKDYSHIQKFPYPEEINVEGFVYESAGKPFQYSYHLKAYPEDVNIDAIGRKNPRVMNALYRRIRKEFPDNVIEFGRWDENIMYIHIYDQYDELYVDKVRPAATRQVLGILNH